MQTGCGALNEESSLRDNFMMTHSNSQKFSKVWSNGTVHPLLTKEGFLEKLRALIQMSRTTGAI
jgi:hypothetical protein